MCFFATLRRSSGWVSTPVSNRTSLLRLHVLLPKKDSLLSAKPSDIPAAAATRGMNGSDGQRAVKAQHGLDFSSHALEELIICQSVERIGDPSWPIEIFLLMVSDLSSDQPRLEYSEAH